MFKSFVAIIFIAYFQLSTENDTGNNETDNTKKYVRSLSNEYSNCSTCLEKEEVQSLRIESLKANILDKLNLKRPPKLKNPIPNIPIIQQMIDDLEAQRESAITEKNNYYAFIPKMIIFNSEAPTSTHIRDDMKPYIVYFSLSDEVFTNSVINATMWIYIQPLQMQATVMLNISLISTDPNRHSDSSYYIQLDNQQVGKWSSYDIGNFVSHWVSYPNENLGIFVQALTNDGGNLVIINTTNGDEAKKPFLEMHFNDSNTNRNKRQAIMGMDCPTNSNEELCCRYPLTVNFKQMNWTWIIYPEFYESYYCYGNCPYVFLQKYGNTNLVQQLNPSKYKGPCCAASKTQDLSILYKDNKGRIKLSVLPNIVILKCGCF